MSICDSIKRKYIRLSKGQRKVAQFVLDNPAVVASHVAVEVGRLAGVSESTVIRFCYAMDLAGFSELQEKIKEHLRQTGVLVSSTTVKEDKSSPNKSTSMLEDIAAIKTLVNHVQLEQVEQCAQLIDGAEKIHILSFNQLTPTATWLYHYLKPLKQSIYLHQYSNLVTNEEVIHVDKEALLIVFIEDEHIETILDMLSSVKGNVLNVMAIAPNEQYKSALNVEQFLALQPKDTTTSYSAAAVISLLEALLKRTKLANKETTAAVTV